LPGKVETNIDLQKENPNSNIEKIFEKSGVFQRHIATETETAFDLSQKACDKIFQIHDKNEVDGVICCTQSPDYIIPSNAFLLHNYLKLSEEVFAFDFNHACTGYIYGLAMAHSFILSGLAKQILFVTADTYSKYLNKGDLSTRVLFGDGAACSIIEKSNTPDGIVDILLSASGKNYNKFWIPAGGMRLPKSDQTSTTKTDPSGNIRSQENITMNGLDVWSFINSSAPKQIKRLLKNNKLEKKDIDLFIFHQSSQMTLESIIKNLKLDREKVFINIRDIGNTVSASIPIAIKDALTQGQIQKGYKVVLSGFGAGLSYGAILMEF
jgi:3-oxoacyl-[acyl-carrier-protein] synthase III